MTDLLLTLYNVKIFFIYSGSQEISVPDGRRNSCHPEDCSLSRSASDSSMTTQPQPNTTINNHRQTSPNATMLPNNHGSVFVIISSLYDHLGYVMIKICCISNRLRKVKN